MALFLLFEASITIIALIATHFLEINGLIYLLLLLCIRSVTGSIAPMYLGFLRAYNNKSIFLFSCSSMILSVFSIYAFNLDIFSNFQSHHIFENIDLAFFSFLLIAFISFSPLLRANFAPIGEWDSLFSFNAIVEWFDLKLTPYHMDYDYPSLWECRLSLPILAHRKYGGALGLVTIAQLEATAIFGLALWLVAYNLVPSEWFATASAFSGLSLYHFWCTPSGLSGLKNDIAFNAGLMVFTLAGLLFLNASVSLPVALILGAIGASLAAVKYSAVVVLPGTVAVFFVANVRLDGVATALEFLAYSFAIALIAMVVTGHFYLKNWIKFKNPLYPVHMKIGSVELPGWAHLQNTSILEGLTNESTRSETLKRLFGRHNFASKMVWPAGLLIFGSIPAALIIVLFQPFLSNEINLNIWVISLAGLMGIWAYIISAGAGSAWDNPGDLFHLQKLYSLRYAATPVCLITTAALAAISQVPFGVAIATLIFILDAILRAIPAFLHHKHEGNLIITKTVAIVLLALLIIIISAYVAPDAIWPISAFLATILILQIPSLAAEARSHWKFFTTLLSRHLAEAAPSDIFILDQLDLKSGRLSLFRSYLFVAGTRFQHRAQTGSLAALQATIERGRRPEYVSGFCWPAKLPANFELMQALSHSGVTQDYLLIDRDDHCFLLKSMSDFPPFAVPVPGGDPDLIEPMALRIASNGGTLHAAVQDSGAKFHVRSPLHTQIEEATLRRIRDGYLLSSAISDTGMTPQWSVWPSGRASFDPPTRRLRLLAGESDKGISLTISVTGSMGRVVPISVVAKVRSIGGAEINLHASGSTPSTKGQRDINRVRDFGVLEDFRVIALSNRFDTTVQNQRIGIGALNLNAGEGFEVEFLELISFQVDSESPP